MANIVNESINKHQLLRDLISISNNSVITNNVSRILGEKLDPADLRAIYDWIQIVKRENQQNNRNLGFGNPNFKRY